MEMKYLKWLNMIPLIMFFIVDKLRGTLISRYLLITIVVLGVMNTLIAKGMKEYCISSLMLVVSTVAGMILYTYYYYYFVNANPEAPIFGAAIMMVYGFIALAVAAVGTVVVVVKDRYLEKADINEEVEILPSHLTQVSGGRGFTTGYKRCRQCGYETTEDFDFCPKCGTRF